MAISSWGGCGWPIYAVGATRCRLEIHPYDKYSWRKNHTIYPQNLFFSPTANPNSFPLPDPSISHSQNQTEEKILVFTLILLWILLISIFCVSFLNFWDWVLLCLPFFFLMCFPSFFLCCWFSFGLIHSGENWCGWNCRLCDGLSELLLCVEKESGGKNFKKKNRKKIKNLFM